MGLADEFVVRVEINGEHDSDKIGNFCANLSKKHTGSFGGLAVTPSPKEDPFLGRIMQTFNANRPIKIDTLTELAEHFFPGSKVSLRVASPDLQSDDPKQRLPGITLVVDT